MQKTIIMVILMTFVSLVNASNQTEKIIGYWFCETVINIKKIEVDDIEIYKVRDSQIDTLYEPYPFLLEINEDGTFNGFAGELKGGTWKVKKNMFVFKIGRLRFLGSFNNDKLILTNNKDDSKLIMSKLEINGNINFNKELLLDKKWTITEDDTVNTSFHFIDNETVVIKNGWNNQIGAGDWKLFNYAGFYFLNIFNRGLLENKTYILNSQIDDNFSGFMFEFDMFERKYPNRKNILLEQNPILDNKQFENIFNNLQGVWVSTNNFYEIDTIFNDVLLIDTYFKLSIDKETFTIEYGGKNKNTQQLIEIKINGNYELSKTGDYLKLSFERQIRDRKFQTIEYIAINKLTTETNTIILKLRSLTDEHFVFLGKIDLKKE